MTKHLQMIALILAVLALVTLVGLGLHAAFQPVNPAAYSKVQ